MLSVLLHKAIPGPQQAERTDSRALTLFINLTPTKEPGGITQHPKMGNVFFKPWIGSDFEKGGIFGKKILILGESHYCKENLCPDCGKVENADECAEFTSKNCIEKYLEGSTENWTPTFRKFERSLVNHETDMEESKRIWNSVAIYNYIQRAMDKARKAPEWVDFRNSDKAFFEVLDELQPELMLVWGVTRMYDNLPGGDRWAAGEELIIDDYKVKNGYYHLSNGNKVRVLWVYHPSTGYAWDWWNKIIRTEL